MPFLFTPAIRTSEEIVLKVIGNFWSDLDLDLWHWAKFLRRCGLPAWREMVCILFFVNRLINKNFRGYTDSISYAIFDAKSWWPLAVKRFDLQKTDNIFVLSSSRSTYIYVFWSDLLLVAESVAESVAEYAANLTDIAPQAKSLEHPCADKAGNGGWQCCQW